MKIDYLYELLLFVVLTLLQVLVFNQISVFGLATPFLYIYFLLKLPVDRNVFYVIILGYLMGFTLDVFLNTPGINAAATTLVAASRKPLLRLFFDKDIPATYIPSLNSYTWAFIKFSIVAVVIHQTVLYGLEAFSLFNPEILVLRWVTSIVLTLTLIFALDSLISKTFIHDE